MKKNFLKVIIFFILYKAILNKEALSLQINKSNLTIDNISSSNYRHYEIGEISNLSHFVVSLKTEDELQKKPVDIICLVDISFRLEEYFDLIKKSLIRLSIPLNEQDSLAIITFYQSGNIITNLTKMTPENHILITNKIYRLKVENKGYDSRSYLKFGFKIALDFLTQDYSSAERIASIFIFTENGNNLYWGLNELINDNRMNYTFTINGFFYGNSRSSNEILLPQFKDGGYYIIKEESVIPDISKQIYGALSSIIYVNIELEIKTNYEIKHVFGIENMYEASLTSNNNTSTFRNKIIQFISGKKYTFNFLLDIPQNISLGTEVLNATVLPLKITSQYYFEQKNNSFAYEEFIKCMVYTYICDAKIFEQDKTTSFAQKGINWIESNYKGQKDWVKVLEDVILDAKNGLINNIESKKRSLIYSPLGNYFSSNNFLQNSVNYSPHQKYYEQFPIIKVTKEKIIKIEENIFYYSFFLKEGLGEVNDMPFYGNGINIIIYSEDNKDNINIKSLSDNLEFYYFNQSRTQIEMDTDLNNGGIFMIKKDFPLAFFSWTDGSRDITFNIELLKLECEGNADIIVHLFEIYIYIFSQLDLLNLNSLNVLSKETCNFQGFYDEKLKLGKFVIRKEEIIKYINKYDGNYLFVVVNKKDNSKKYKYIEGKFIFASMDFIYSPIPEDFYIFSNLSKENKYHLYTLTMEVLIGKYIRIEFGTSSNQIDCKILKYKGYEENSEELYVDFNEYNITRTKNKNITYIDVFQSNKEETKIEYIIISIIFININSIDTSDTSDYSYTLKYNSYSYNEVFNKNNNDNSQFNNSTKDSDTNNSSPIDSNGNNNNDDNEMINSKIKVIFLGFAKFLYIRTIKLCYFYIYFASSIKKVSITKIYLYIRIKYKTNAESLQNESKQIQCLLFENEFISQNQFRYNCSFEINGEELENVGIIENNLDGQNIEIIDNSSMAIQFMDNIQNVGDTDIFNKKLYIFKDSNLHIDYNKKIINITGTIDDISFHYVSLYLTIIIIEYDNSKHMKNIYCDIYNLNDNNYKLVCNSENETYLKLNGAFANLGEENLVIYFNDDINSTIYFNSSTDNRDEIYLNIKNRKKKKMPAGTIIAIILPIIFVIILIVFLLIWLNKNPTINNNGDTTLGINTK